MDASCVSLCQAVRGTFFDGVSLYADGMTLMLPRHMVILVVTRMFASKIVAVPLKPTYATVEDAVSFLQWVYAVTDALRVVSPLSLLIALICESLSSQIPLMKTSIRTLPPTMRETSMETSWGQAWDAVL